MSTYWCSFQFPSMKFIDCWKYIWFKLNIFKDLRTTNIDIKTYKGANAHVAYAANKDLALQGVLMYKSQLDSGYYTPAQRSWRGGGYTGFTLSVRLSVRPSVCRRRGFRSIS